jgi:aryl-alcohol dehydrogenase-like predicted oxidoreductase
MRHSPSIKHNESMKHNKFAKTEESISQLGFGCWGIGKSSWIGADDKESLNCLRIAIEQGINFFDTAYVYGKGHSEKLLGEAERLSGKKLFIATKIPSRKYEWPAYYKSTLEDSFPYEHMLKITDISLKNLGRDYIDLQQFHVWNDTWAKEDSWKESILKLKEQGKVRFFGISMNDHQAENGIEAAKSGLIDCFQVIFNIFDQSPIRKLFDFCKENKISIIARVPLDEGGLTGKINSNSQFPDGDFRNKYFSGNRKKEVEERVNKIWSTAKNENSSMAEAALRFIISFEEITSVIPGMRNAVNLQKNITAVNKGPLSLNLIEELKKFAWERNFYI